MAERILTNLYKLLADQLDQEIVDIKIFEATSDNTSAISAS